MSLAIAISKQMIADIKKHGEGLQAWETDHLTNYATRLEGGRELSRKQGQILHGIYSRRINFAKPEDPDAARQNSDTR